MGRAVRLGLNRGTDTTLFEADPNRDAAYPGLSPLGCNLVPHCMFSEGDRDRLDLERMPVLHR